MTLRETIPDLVSFKGIPRCISIITEHQQVCLGIFYFRSLVFSIMLHVPSGVLRVLGFILRFT